MERSDKNAISLAGEFAVLSQLALLNYDANMTLGRTKDVDILVSTRSKKMYRWKLRQSCGLATRKPLSRRFLERLSADG